MSLVPLAVLHFSQAKQRLLISVGAKLGSWNDMFYL